jgi:hypothetical protein
MKSQLAFSNGTEFEIWQESWCSRCTKDEPARRGDFENGCELIALGMIGEEIPEWTEDPDATGWPRVLCSEFASAAPVEGTK